MFKLKFKKDDCCKLTVEVESTECELDKIKREATEKAEIDYKKQKRYALLVELKNGLYKQYGVDKDSDFTCDYRYDIGMAYMKEYKLLNAMLENMIDDLGLMDD